MPGPTVNQALEDALTERDVMVQRYQRGLISRVLGLLARLEEAVLAALQGLDPTSVQPRYRDARLARLMVVLGERVDAYGTQLREAVLPDLLELARDEAAFGVRVLSETLPVLLDVITPTTQNLRAAADARPFQGRNLREWVADQPAQVRARLRQTIRQAVADGSTVDQVARTVRGTAASGYKDGVMEVSRRGAQALVRTAVNHTVSFAREETYAANEDILKGVRWVSTLDSRTSDVCMARDGKVYPVRSGPRPPAHVNCRSSTVPVVKSWRELGVDLADAPKGTRASMDGQVPAGQTYQQFLSKKPAAFQDEVLGAAKGRLFRAGGLRLDQFVDNSGHSYTLAQLRARQPQAFERAGL